MKLELTPMALIVILVSAIQFIWGLCLVLGLDIVYIAALDSYTKEQPILLGVFGITAACLAYSRIIWDTPRHNIWFLIPQQILLLHSCISIIESAILGHYPDGTVKPGVFIINDQLPLILVAVKYTILIIFYPSTKYENEQRNRLGYSS